MRCLFVAALLVAAAVATPTAITPVTDKDDELSTTFNTVADFAQRFIQASNDQDAGGLISTAVSAMGWASQITEEDMTHMEAEVTAKINEFADKVQQSVQKDTKGEKKFPGVKHMFQAVLEALPQEAADVVIPQVKEATKANPMLAAFLPYADTTAATSPEHKDTKLIMDSVVALTDDWLDMSMRDSIPPAISEAVEKFNKGEDQGVQACPLLAALGQSFAHILGDVKEHITSFSDFSDLGKDYEDKLSELHPTMEEQIRCISPTGKPQDASVGFLVKQVLSLPEVREGVTEAQDLATTINDKMQSFTQVFAALNGQ